MRKSTHFMLVVQLLLVVSVPSLSALADDTKKPPSKTPSAQTGPKGDARGTTKDTTKGTKDTKGAGKDAKGKGGSDAHRDAAGRDRPPPGGEGERNVIVGAPCSSGNALAGALGSAIGGTAGQLISGAVPCR